MSLTIVSREGTHTATLSLGSDVDQIAGVYQIRVELIHEWGFEVLASTLATRTGAGEYEYVFVSTDLKSSGVHNVKWTYISGGTTYTTDQYIDVVQQHTSSEEFFALYPDMSAEFSSQFDWYEKQARQIIEPFCGQDFQFISGGSISYDGTGKSVLPLYRRLDSFTEVLLDAVDITDSVEFFPGDLHKRHLRYIKSGDEYTGFTRTKFSEDSEIEITGDWGWPYIPDTVRSASQLLIFELMTDDRVNYTHGIDQLWMDTQRTEFKDGIFDTTGNLDVDTLLMDYTILEIGLV